MRFITFYSLCFVLFFQSCTKSIDNVDGTQLAVFNEAPHNGFTDLIKYDGYYYCVFREGAEHDSHDGKLRVMQSFDATNWTKFSLLTIQGKDLRDPHFFIDNDNMLSIGTNARNQFEQHENIVFKLQNENFFQSSSDSVSNVYWLWSFTKSKENIFSIGYNLMQPCFNNNGNNEVKIGLFQNTNAASTNYKNVASYNWINKDFQCPCESSLVFLNDSTAVTIVRDEDTPGFSHIGISKKPFSKWSWKTFPCFVKGPKLALLPNGKLLLAAGAMAAYFKVYYAIVDPANFSIEKILAFPSGGDCGYPGVIIEGNTALVSYYSSHEGNARVYINRITY